MAKVIQIATGHDAGAHTLYALDAHGSVWRYRPFGPTGYGRQSDWVQLPKLPVAVGEGDERTSRPLSGRAAETAD